MRSSNAARKPAGRPSSARPAPGTPPGLQKRLLRAILEAALDEPGVLGSIGGEGDSQIRLTNAKEFTLSEEDLAKLGGREALQRALGMDEGSGAYGNEGEGESGDEGGDGSDSGYGEDASGEDAYGGDEEGTTDTDTGSAGQAEDDSEREDDAGSYADVTNEDTETGDEQNPAEGNDDDDAEGGYDSESGGSSGSTTTGTQGSSRSDGGDGTGGGGNDVVYEQATVLTPAQQYAIEQQQALLLNASRLGAVEFQKALISLGYTDDQIKQLGAGFANTEMASAPTVDRFDVRNVGANSATTGNFDRTREFQELLANAARGDPTAIDEVYRRQVQDPLLEQYTEEVMPQILAADPRAAYSGGVGRNIDKSREQLTTALVRARADYAFKAQESAADRAVTAATAGGQLDIGAAEVETKAAAENAARGLEAALANQNVDLEVLKTRTAAETTVEVENLKARLQLNDQQLEALRASAEVEQMSAELGMLPEQILAAVNAIPEIENIVPYPEGNDPDSMQAFITAALTGLGTAAGAAAGAAATSYLCIMVARRGDMPADMLAADIAFSHTVDATTKLGYRWWALPLVRACDRHEALYLAVRWLVLRWATEMAFRMGARPHGSLVGSALFAVGAPACAALGRLRRRFFDLPEPAWASYLAGETR